MRHPGVQVRMSRAGLRWWPGRNSGGRRFGWSKCSTSADRCHPTTGRLRSSRWLDTERFEQQYCDGQGAGRYERCVASVPGQSTTEQIGWPKDKWNGRKFTTDTIDKQQNRHQFGTASIRQSLLQCQASFVETDRERQLHRLAKSNSQINRKGSTEIAKQTSCSV